MEDHAETIAIFGLAFLISFLVLMLLGAMIAMASQYPIMWLVYAIAVFVASTVTYFATR